VSKHCGDRHHEPPPHVGARNLISRVPKNSRHRASCQDRSGTLDGVEQIDQDAPFPSECTRNVGSTDVSTANGTQVHAIQACHDGTKRNAAAAEGHKRGKRPVRGSKPIDGRGGINEHKCDIRQRPSGCLHWSRVLAPEFGHRQTRCRWHARPQ